MTPLSLIAVLLCLASVFGVINCRFLKLPRGIGFMAASMATSLGIFGLDLLLPHAQLRTWSEQMLGTRELPQALLNGVLAFLLFAGALELDAFALWKRKFTVLLLSTVGVFLATGLFAAGIFLVFRMVGTNVPFAWCIVLGAVLAPTDPIAIKSVLSRIDLPPNLHAVQAGESLFNDGAAVVVFNIALGVAVGSEPAPAPGHLVLVFLREVIGGALLGAASGWLAYQAMRRIDDYPLEIMISLALAAGAYSLAQAAGASGPIAVVVAGLIIGNRATRYAMSETTRRNLELFWSVIDELLNAMLFVLLGSEILSLSFGGPQVAATLIAIPLSLAVRAVTIVVTVLWLHLGNPRKWAGATVLTWSGLRGGISVALALSLPVTPWRQEFLFICYGVVVFTILVQGLTVERVIKLVYPNGGSRLA